MQESAAIVVAQPLSVVETHLWDVAGWAAFLPGVELIVKVADERYLFHLCEGRMRQQVAVALRWHPRTRQFTWQELSGPPMRGRIELQPLNGRRTRVTVLVTRQPRGRWARARRLLGSRPPLVEAGLVSLADRFARLPRPFNPGRLHPGARRVAGRRVPARPSVAAPAAGAVERDPDRQLSGAGLPAPEPR